MPSGKKTLPPPRASTTAELDPKIIESYWKFLEVCLRAVFKKSDKEAHKAVAVMRSRIEELLQPAALLLYHDSPLQIAAILAGASDRELTEQELLAYDKVWNPNMPDRPTREQILQVHRHLPKAM